MARKPARRAKPRRANSTASTGGGIAAVRGAVPVRANTASDIQTATARLLRELVRVNRLSPASIVSALFTTTADLNADFPAHAARRLGWSDVPMLHAREIPVPGSMPRVVRVLLTLRNVPARRRLQPVYLEGAARLRPDLVAAAAPEPSHRARPRGARPTLRLAVIGTGQIGGSIGLALAQNPRWHRIGWDRDPAALRRAHAAGAFDEAARSLEAACRSADLVVLAAPVDALPRLIRQSAAALPHGAALLDTGSARRGVTEALREAARHGVRAVGGHPIAGNEGHGFAAARADLFRGAAFALLPVRSGVPAIARELVRDLGARLRIVSPARHDRALARTSHLPYLLARALRERGGSYSRSGLSGPGYRDMTRLAGSDPRVAEAYCRANALEVALAWSEVRETIERELRQLKRR